MDVHWKAVDGFPLGGPSRISNGCTVVVLFMDVFWTYIG